MAPLDVGAGEYSHPTDIWEVPPGNQKIDPDWKLFWESTLIGLVSQLILPDRCQPTSPSPIQYEARGIYVAVENQDLKNKDRP